MTNPLTPTTSGVDRAQSDSGGRAALRTCAMCGHATEDSRQQCPRCGEIFNFSETRQLVQADYRSTETLAVLITLLYAGQALLLVASGAANWRRNSLLNVLQPGDDRTAAIRFIDEMGSGIWVCLMVVKLVAAITFLIWVFRSNQNAHALGAKGMRYTPGWSVGWFFVPIMNWLKPYWVIKEIWEASDPDVERSSATPSAPPLLGYWWGLWVLSWMIYRGSIRIGLHADEIGTSVMSAKADIGEISIKVPAVLLTIVVVRSITTRQTRRHEALSHM